MRYPFFSAVYFPWLFPLLQSLTWAQTLQSILWNVPDGKRSDFSQTFNAGITLALSWNQYSYTAYIDPTQTLVNLWVSAFDFDSNPYSQLLTEDLNLTSPGNYLWFIDIPASNLTLDAKYVLRFKALAPTFNPDTPDLSSPGFLVLRAAAQSSSSTLTSSLLTTSTFANPSAARATASASSYLSPTVTPKAACSTCRLGSAAKAGIGVGALIAVLAAGCLIYLIYLLMQKKNRMKRRTELLQIGMENHASHGDFKYGHNVYPVELAAAWNQREAVELSAR